MHSLVEVQYQWCLVIGNCSIWYILISFSSFAVNPMVGGWTLQMLQLLCLLLLSFLLLPLLPTSLSHLLPSPSFFPSPPLLSLLLISLACAGDLHKATGHLEIFYQLARKHKWHTDSGDSLDEIACEHLRRVYTSIAEEVHALFYISLKEEVLAQLYSVILVSDLSWWPALCHSLLIRYTHLLSILAVLCRSMLIIPLMQLCI